VTQTPIKMIYLGHTGMGKTGSLCSLAAAGYRLKIMDLEAKAGIVRNMLTDERSPYFKQNPKAIDNVSIATLTEALELASMEASKKAATVWPRAKSVPFKWVDDVGKDHGSIRQWTTQDVWVIDSLKRLGDACQDFFVQMNSRLHLPAHDPKSAPQAFEWGIVQNMLGSYIEAATLAAIPCNVIFISHIEWIGDEKTGLKQGVPSAVGKKLAPLIPRYFNNMLLAETKASRRIISTNVSSTGIALKNENPYAVANEYPLETGLADYFKAIQGPLA